LAVWLSTSHQSNFLSIVKNGCSLNALSPPGPVPSRFSGSRMSIALMKDQPSFGSPYFLGGFPFLILNLSVPRSRSSILVMRVEKMFRRVNICAAARGGGE